MKKLLVFALTAGMVIGVNSISRAAGTVYLDVLNGGERGIEISNGVCRAYDLSQTTFGFDVPYEQFKIGGSFSKGEFEQADNKNLDTSCFMLKGGIPIVNNGNIRFDITGGYYNRNYDDFNYAENDTDLNYTDNTISFTSFIVGLDSKFTVQDNVWFDINFGYGINPEYEYESMTIGTNQYTNQKIHTNCDSLYILNVKLNCLFNKQFGGAVGYAWEQWNTKYSYAETYSGLTAGLFVKF